MTFRIRFLAVGIGLTIATAAHAFAIDTRCDKFIDKIACTCALQAGGHLTDDNGHRRWFYPKSSTFAYRQCTVDNGEK